MIALYERVSTDLQAEKGHSIEEQQIRLEKYCEALDLKGFIHYTDAGFSGADMNRPALQKLLEDVRTHKIEKVIVYKLDRLSRSQKDTLFLIEDVFLKNDCDFISVTEKFDTSSPLGKAMIGIISVFAQLERETIKERLTLGRDARAKKGLFHGGNSVPIGYTYKDGSLIVDEKTAPLVREIFNLYESGKSLTRVADDLNLICTTPRGGKWHYKNVKYILTNIIYIGMIKSKETAFKGLHEGIISEEQFYKVQSLIEQRSRDSELYKRRTGKSVSLLGSLCFCERCGRKYSRKMLVKNKRKYYYYECRSRKNRLDNCNNKAYRMEELDNMILDEIRKLRLEDIEREARQPDKLPMLETELVKIQNQINKVLDLYTLDGINFVDLQEKLQSLNQIRDNITAEIEKIRQENEDYSPDVAIDYINSFDDIINRANFEELKTMLEALIEKITIDGDDITIYWRFS